MKNKKNMLLKLIKNIKMTKPQKMITLALSLMSIFALPTLAADSNGFSLNFDVTEMFQWAQVILDALMPVLYITLGVGLAFIIIRALKNAFN